MPAALFAIQLLEALPGLIIAGQNVVNLIESSTAAFKLMVAENREPTDAEWDALNAATAALQAQLHAPDAA